MKGLAIVGCVLAVVILQPSMSAVYAAAHWNTTIGLSCVNTFASSTTVELYSAKGKALGSATGYCPDTSGGNTPSFMISTKHEPASWAVHIVTVDALGNTVCDGRAIGSTFPNVVTCTSDSGTVYVTATLGAPVRA
jgi:hypothetical protein